MPITLPTPAASLPQTSPDCGAAHLAEQLDAYAAELQSLTAQDWSRATDCARWNVRQIAAHVVGALDEGAHLGVLLRHVRAAKRSQHELVVDGMNDAQVADRQDCAGPDLVTELQRLAPVAIRKRRKAPRFIRNRPVPPSGLPRGATMGYLFDVIFTRDVWMHRVDTARAAGRAVRPTDGESAMTAQVLRDLSRTWTGEAWVLELTGAVPGSWLIGSGEPAGRVRADTVEYLRRLSGRAADQPALLSGPAALLDAAAAARVGF